MSINENIQNYLEETYIAARSCMFKSSMGNKMPYLHWHTHFEIMLIQQGNYSITHNNLTIRGTKPLALVHYPYSLHNGTAASDALYVRHIINFNRQLMNRVLSDALIITPPHATLLYAEPNPLEISELMDFGAKLQEYQDDSTMHMLLIALILRKIMMICKAGRGKTIQTQHSYIHDVLQYIPEHLSEPKTAAELAALFRVCPAKFHRDFRTSIGKTYKQHLTDLRQTLARELLDANADIINTAMDTGYSSEAHFIKAFREYWGMTPGAYLKTHQKHTAVTPLPRKVVRTEAHGIDN